ncbi:cytochrome-c peroxidase [Poseidonibacter ostreae]|jgi:cytochrome c peroxidase|uniref:C-type cytochrome n=1 Tax=Poseidonibacter ostreae TaxID=2654171 RepID=A0A6L4WVW6_9BACT|nr:cytochrome c peroxidase [Poseidonibacter ostreae]KAB7886974.1 c-type cytochrome [Poseidonibacter ostreae]KAB7887391.1 c-type cytochrome [Poseidonibacter ostreae]KAB7890769.1 c-type cytochrome [Poseidonibacter ostreae]
MPNFFILIIFICFNMHANIISPIPQSMPTDEKKVALGKLLFNDTRLSVDNTISCASCHLLNEGGDDNKSVSTGVNGLKGELNSPTVFNSVFNFKQFWDGRADNLKEQALGPILNPIEMGNNFDTLIVKLEKTEYLNIFNNIYLDGITQDNIVDAISEYEKTLITPNSDFDMYLKGDTNAITQVQKEGYAIFKEKGCISCHHGINIGANLYSKLGVIIDPSISHLGMTNKDKEEKFKVPSLRNVAKTAPYLHNGSIKTLNETVKTISLYQLGRELKDDEIYKIVKFLESLNGKIKEERK